MTFEPQTDELQLESFKRLSEGFTDTLSVLKHGEVEKTDKKQVKEEWEEIIAKLYSLYTTKELRSDFLHNSVITHALFMNSQGDLMAHQIELCKQQFSIDELKDTLKESPVGKPPKAMTWEFDTTHNSIHHLYHMSRYKRRTKKTPAAASRVIEWGGGYGNFCKLVCKLPNSQLKTYTIIDLPEISALQWIYLSSVFGEDKVNIVAGSNKVEEGKINLVSIPNLDKVDSGYNLFVSTWALSESPVEMHQFVEGKNWFNADSMLMAIHQCGDHIPFMKESTNVGLLAKKFGAKIEDVQVIPGKNYYIFK